MYIDFGKFKKKFLYKNNIEVFEDKNLFYLWKFSWIPSSFGKEKSILDLLENNELENNFTKNQLTNFDKEQEYWLLNRLDNDTSWFLYFAKNKETYNKFKFLQKNENIEKIYYAKVKQDNRIWTIFVGLDKVIDFPIMHKNKTKMIVIKTKNDEKKWRWKKHFVKTHIKVIEKKDSYLWLKVAIKKWIRHQIRVHLSSIWAPIVWDKLYWWEDSDKLYLFSVGIIWFS